jgi:hypothetical protein
MPRGGHFVALEAPELLAADVTTFFCALRGADRLRAGGRAEVWHKKRPADDDEGFPRDGQQPVACAGESA